MDYLLNLGLDSSTVFANALNLDIDSSFSREVHWKQTVLKCKSSAGRIEEAVLEAPPSDRFPGLQNELDPLAQAMHVVPCGSSEAHLLVTSLRDEDL